MKHESSLLERFPGCNDHDCYFIGHNSVGTNGTCKCVINLIEAYKLGKITEIEFRFIIQHYLKLWQSKYYSYAKTEGKYIQEIEMLKLENVKLISENARLRAIGR